MENLDWDSLAFIFSFFGFKERVQLERVCKKWRDVMQKHRVYLDKKEFNLKEYLFDADLHYYQQNNLTFEPTTLSIIKRCGPFLTKLDFGARWQQISKSIINSIAINCLQLTVLDLSAVIMRADIGPVLKEIGKQLKVLSLEDTSWSFEEDAKNVGKHFHMMENLHEIYLKNCGIEMADILEIPSQLKKVDLSSNWQLSPKTLLQFLQVQNSLTYLALCPMPGGQFPAYSVQDPTDGLEDVINTISSINTLKYLSLGNISYDPLILKLNSLGRLSNLHVLVLKQVTALTGESLAAILRANVQLRELTVAHCQKVFDFTGITQCKELRILEIERTANLCDEDVELLAEFGKLEKVRLKRCYNITCQGVEALLDLCNITEIDLTDCDQITDWIFPILCRLPKLPNHIYLGGCKKISVDGLVTLCSSDLSNLEDLDVSRNHNIDRNFVQKLYHKLHEKSEISEENRKEPLRIYLYLTSVEEEMTKKVEPYLELIF